MTAGQHVQLRLEPQGFNCGVAGTTRSFQLRLFKGTVGTAGDTLLANSNIANFASEIVFDANETATYLFRVRNVRTSGVVTGTYTVKSRLLTYGAPSPGRDMRDIVVARSTNQGVSFGPEVRVNNDPPNQDNCIPAITVDQKGCVHAFYYDTRDANASKTCALLPQRVVGWRLTWPSDQRISNSLNYFNLNTVAVPNYGEYNQACTVVNNTNNLVYASWSDERLATAPVGQSGVDAWVAAMNCCVTTSCPPDTSVTSSDAATRRVCITNCGNFAEDFTYNISDTQGWSTPASGTVNVAAGATFCFDVLVTVPMGTAAGTVTTITLAAAAGTCANVAANCTSNVTAETPTAAMVEDLAAIASDNGVSLRWRVAPESLRDLVGVRVQRAVDAQSSYASIGSRLTPAAEMAFDDTNVLTGQTYWYRLELEDAAGARNVSGPVRVTAGARLGLPTTLHGAHENASGSVDIRFSLASRRHEAGDL